MSARALFVVAGIGNGTGTGASAARVFSKAGYSVALIARGADSLNSLAAEIKASGGDAAPFAIPDYKHESISTAFASIKAHWPSTPLRVALFNAGYGVWGSFLSITPSQFQESVDTSIVGAAAFAREAILEFKGNELNAEGKRGTLLFTGATASLRGNTTTSAFSAGKHGLRALSQSLNKEFGKENIHVAHSIIDGGILTDRSKERRNDPSWENNPDVRLSPDSIANAYLYLANQDRSAFTWELDLRPAHEKW
ncbi:hypothetical protein PLICRDRAFT_45669 [Plicaturopsis crispa FD-325 SS-3]|uniref:Unplaced genomic scaffold PLICRscaffold_16, whole genome shotgun sequence n=1 Tax=Plicaturopsis crispa FD-325 SS-3 TaxID=944288 RepID=A0A0C9SRN5_PLICR|nr:hypothetical protein PLICRDRAFT_45669 [Plicaturopsis crispa FD-325 SS-3]